MSNDFSSADTTPSIIHGAPYKNAPNQRTTLVDCLITTAAQAPNRGLTYLRADGTEQKETYAELLERATGVLGSLRNQGVEKGQPVMIQLNEPEHFVSVFWAALLGGMVPVPLSSLLTLGRGGNELGKTYRIYETLEQPLIVTDTKTQKALNEQIALTGMTPLRLAAYEDCAQEKQSAQTELTPSLPDETAFIQFSSGSTGTPKGVCLTHQNLVHNIVSIFEHQEGKPEDCFVSWLPLFHDMGIIGYHLLPTVLQAKQVLMQPRQFMKRPFSWLKALHDHKGSCTASPNFGLNRVLAKVTPEKVSELDLSHMHCLLNGSEPISWDVLNRFTKLLEPAGFSPKAMSPGYGLAEGSLCISARPAQTLPKVHHINRETLDQINTVVTNAEPTQTSIALVEVGTAVAGVSIRIVNALDETVKSGTVGHIQIRGPNVTAGYFNAPELNAQTFCNGWLRTGDLGLILDGRLVITGRHKDILFVRGQNYYAHDLEQHLSTLEWFDAGRTAVFASPNPNDGSDVICLAGVFKSTSMELEKQCEETRLHIADAFGFQLDHIIPVRPKDIPKTSSGKIQRHQLKKRFETGEFNDVLHSLPTSPVPPKSSQV